MAVTTGFSVLRKRIFWTFLLLTIYRVGIYVPLPGVDLLALSEFVQTLRGTVFGLFNMFSGGALERLSVLTLGIVPYISASIVMQLLQAILPSLKSLAREEGNVGKRKISQYTRYLTLLLTFIQGYGVAIGLESLTSPNGLTVVLEPGVSFRIITALTLCTGTLFVMWLGEKISEIGLGNGISVIIFAGIVAGIPSSVFQMYQLLKAHSMSLLLLLLLICFMLVVLYCIVYFEKAQRRVPIHYAKRQIGLKIYGGQATHLPLKLNVAGVIPPIFASSLLLFPSTLQSFTSLSWLQSIASFFTPNSLMYNLVFVILIFFFAYFYTAILFDSKELAENLKKSSAFVPTIRPGERTEEYFNSVLSHLTLWGALYLSVSSLLPALLIERFQLPFYFGGTSLLIIVGVAIDIMGQFESHLISEQYGNLVKSSRK